jgi:catechol 2,3-dioxygenase-like lactoylglutathione lyase family enzyme
MGRIVHIALKCKDMQDFDKATKFYEDIFNIYQTKNTHARGHHSRHMTDGNIDLALMLYDSEDEKEAKLAGAGARIHHIGLEVLDRPSMIKKIEDNGGTIYSDRAEGALKYFSPDGTLGEIVAVGRYPTHTSSSVAKITRVMLKVKDLAKAKAFYKNVFDFKDLGGKDGEGWKMANLSDGDTTLSLVEYASEGSEQAMLAGEGPGIQLWGMSVKDPKELAQQVTAKGGKILDEKDGIRFRGPDGNVAELIAA